MGLVDLFFFLFAGLLIGSSLVVVLARNPVHAVIFLILAFFNASGLFVLLGAEFIAMLLVIVYVGAVAVLFLFVVMMLDVDSAELRQGFVSYMPFGALVALVLAFEIILLVVGHVEGDITLGNPGSGSEVSNVEAIGRVLYTDYVFAFQVAGLILLLAMIGAIVLSHYLRPDVQRQDVSIQVYRKREESVEIRKVKSGEGV